MAKQAGVAIVSPGAFPGTDAIAAQRADLDVFADPPSGILGLPGLLVLPGRGPAASPVGRTLAMAEAMAASLESHGWRLALTPGSDQRRAAQLLADDVETLALGLAGEACPVQLPVLGPFSLAAAVWLPRGERLITDPIALEDLVEALALGVARHLQDVTRARDLPALLPPAAEPVPSGPGQRDERVRGRAPTGPGSAAPATILLHEPWLGHGLAGRLPSFSGRARLAAVRAEVITRALERLIAAWAGHDVVVQVPPEGPALEAAGAARPAGLRFDGGALSRPGWEDLAPIIEAGVGVTVANVPHSGAERFDVAAAAERVLRPFRLLGLRPTLLPLALQPGLVDLPPAVARASLAGLTRTAVALGELLLAD